MSNSLAAPFLTEEEREYRYYDSAGYKINGEVFLPTNGYLTQTCFFLGAGSTDFAGDERFTVTLERAIVFND